MNTRGNNNANTGRPFRNTKEETNKISKEGRRSTALAKTRERGMK
jgi:hypothetical protein